MSKVLILKSSILGGYSQSAVLIDHLASHWENQGAAITVRDLGGKDVLPMVDGEIASGLRGGAELSARQQEMLALSDTLVAELKRTTLSLSRHLCITLPFQPNLKTGSILLPAPV